MCPALDRHPRARHLSLTKDRHSHVKGPQVCSRATTTSLVAPCTWTTIKTNDDDDDNINDRSIDDIINDNDDDDNTLTSSPSHPTLTHYATHLVSASHPRCIARLVDTKKSSLFPLHRLARLRVTRRLHHPPSGTSDRARAVGPPRAAPIARLPPVSLISQVLGLVAPHALRNLLGVVQHLLDVLHIFVSPRPNRISRFPCPTRPHRHQRRFFPSHRCLLEYKA